VYFWVAGHVRAPAGVKVLAALGLTFLLSTLAYLIAERPVLRLRRRTPLVAAADVRTRARQMEMPRRG